MTAPAHPPVHEAFRAQARRTPDAVAVEAGGATLTYAALQARADRLAAELRHRGVGPETRVGLRMERSPDLVVAMLAVLEAGGAYVPLDPGYPEPRLAYMAGDAGLALVLGGTPLPPAPSPARGEGENGALTPRPPLPMLGEGGNGTGVGIGPGDAPPPERGRVAALRPPGGGPLGADSLAYVVYTSGSTGAPKGVMVPHGALAAHTAWMQRAFPLGPGDRVLQKTPFSFDASVWEFWAPLVAGATLVLAPPGAERDPAGLARLAARERVTVLQAVPTLLRAMLEAGGLEECRTLRRLFCGGEALPRELAERARAATGAEVVNLYGPTETCIDATAHLYGGGAGGATVPIGRATDETRAYVLDGAGEPAADGELYLGGAQVARGYQGRPGPTAERFLPDPFSGEPGARMYRTGDRVRVLAGDELGFRGRLDDQVKVRGFRVEPGEVEVALLRLPGVREAAAAVRERAPGDARLFGYVVPRAGAALSAAELRRALAAELPEHLVPSAVAVLDALPLGPGGKTDRAALPVPQAAGAEYVPPRTPTEERVAAVWREVLGTERVGAEDHFFDLGGHSLLATQVVSRLRARLGVDLALRTFLDAPTLSALAAAVDRAEDARVAALLAEVEGLSDEEAGALYALESNLHGGAAAPLSDPPR